MNISSTNISGTCTLKCFYSFSYSTSSAITATNKGYTLKLTTERSPNAPVIFNDANYNVYEIDIVKPSLHLFNGTRAKAELIINHTPINGGNQLNVCIPIQVGNSVDNATMFLQAIINDASTHAPAVNEQTNLNVSEFTLNKIVPMKPFYSYANSSGDSFIVYDVDNAIYISPDTAANLGRMLTQNPADHGFRYNGGYSLFINNGGPTSSNGDGSGEIYIDCKPTGNSEELTDVTKIRPSIKNDFTIDNPFLLFIVYSLITVAVLYSVYFLILMMTGGPSMFFKKAAASTKP